MKEIIITEQNQQIKFLKGLQVKKKREEERKFLVEGIRFLEEAFHSDCIEKVYVSTAVLEVERISRFLEQCATKDIPVFPVEEKVFGKISETVNSQGIIGIGRQPDWSIENLSQGETFLVLLDGIQDPGNLGTIIRTCHGAGVGGILTTKGTVDVYNPKVLRATMGAIFKLPIVRLEDTSVVLEEFKLKGYQVIAAYLETEINYYNLNLADPTLLVVGNEAKGISQEILALSDLKAKLPMPGSAESLNAAVASGIMVFEALRQRRFKL